MLMLKVDGLLVVQTQTKRVYTHYLRAYNMPDYITRQEFEEAIAALRCVGDQQTIDVTQSPGGQEIRSIQVITEEAPSDTDYVSVSYDSVAEEFTVTVTDLPYCTPYYTSNLTNWLNIASTAFGELTSTLTFDKPSSNAVTTLHIGYNRESASPAAAPVIYWKDSNGNTVVTDATTAGIETETTAHLPQIASLDLNTDGTFTINSQLANKGRISIPPLSNDTYLYVATGVTLIYFAFREDIISGTPGQKTYNYTAPFDDDIILGYSDGDDFYTLDALANSGSYDRYRTVGKVKVDASNNVVDFVAYRDYVPILFSGNVSTINTINVRNGRIINIT